MAKRVGKLSVMVEGTFMHMRDFLLTRNTAGCVVCCQIAKWCNTHLSHSHFAQDDRMLGAGQSQRIVRQKNLIMGPKTKNNCAGEGQQQITTQPDK
jgi:hypothetical protein